VKRLPKFASIVDRDVTLPSNIPIDANDRPHRTRNATIVKKRDTLLMHAPIHVHVLLFHHQQRQHPITKEVLRQSQRPRRDSIMDRLVILPIDAPDLHQLSTPTQGNQNMAQTPVYKKCYNYGQKSHFANVCPNQQYCPDVTTVATSTPNRQVNSTMSTIQ
jgi:hypothetical protein